MKDDTKTNVSELIYAPLRLISTDYSYYKYISIPIYFIFT